MPRFPFPTRRAYPSLQHYRLRFFFPSQGGVQLGLQRQFFTRTDPLANDNADRNRRCEYFLHVLGMSMTRTTPQEAPTNRKMQEREGNNPPARGGPVTT
jgi:hypothetical protein